MKRVVLAAVVSPLVPLMLLVAALQIASDWSAPPAALLLIGGVGALFSYLGFFLFGLPLFLFLRRRGALSPLPLAVSGVLGGVITLAGFNVLLAFLVGTSYAFPFKPAQVAWGAGLGLSASVVFCLIAGILRSKTGVDPK